MQTTIFGNWIGTRSWRALIQRVLGIASLIFCAASASAGTTPRLQLDMNTQASVDSGTLGGGVQKFVALSLSKLDAGTLSAPFTVRLTLPAFTSYAGFNGGGWTCVSAPANVVVCTFPSSLNQFSPNSTSLAVSFNTAAALPVPGNSLFRATAENIERPLPAPLNCTATPSTSGCAEATVPNRESQVTIAASSWSHNPLVFEAGQLHDVRVGFRNIGYGFNEGLVTMRFLLPPGFTYQGAASQLGLTCLTATPGAQGQLLTCTTPYLVNGQNETQIFIVMHLNIALNVPVPGPHPIFATISNAAQPPPDFALCDDAAPPLGCGYYNQITTRAPRQSQMDILMIEPQPAVFRQGAEGSAVITIANLGEGAAGAMNLSVAAPVGFIFSRSTGATPVASCSATGNSATGQVVLCNFAQGLPASLQGSIALVFNIDGNVRPNSNITAAIGDASRPGPSLAQCTLTPAAIGCGDRLLPVSDGIFCNGFETLGMVCGAAL